MFKSTLVGVLITASLLLALPIQAAPLTLQDKVTGMEITVPQNMGVSKDFPAYDMIHSWDFDDGKNTISTLSVFTNSGGKSLESWISDHTKTDPNTKAQTKVFMGVPDKTVTKDAYTSILSFKDIRSLKILKASDNYVYVFSYYYQEGFNAATFAKIKALLSTFRTAKLNSVGIDNTMTQNLTDLANEKPVSTSLRTQANTTTALTVTTTAYKLPWTPGQSKMVTQGWNGSTSHTGTASYAYDFALSLGENVLAAADGTVSYIQSGYTACGKQELINSANYVVIKHPDSTATLYLHLTSVNVAAGQPVSRGQIIGTSGYTGYTGCGPHLHFQRQSQGASWWTQSQAIYFDEYPNQQLTAGNSYKSNNNGSTSITSLDWYKYLLLAGDYDGDKKKDPAYFNPADKTWHMKLSGSNWAESVIKFTFFTNLIPVGGSDFDGDGKTDPAVFDQATGFWQVWQSTLKRASVFPVFGNSNSIPLGKVDIDGDKISDFAYFDNSNGHLVVKPSTGWPVQDKVFAWPGVTPITGSDYDGDGKADLGFYDAPAGMWHFSMSKTGTGWNPNFGWTGTVAIPGGDYDNDGKTDLAFYDPQQGRWHISPSHGGGNWDLQMGWSTAVPIPGLNYDNTSQTKMAIFDRASGMWYLRPNAFVSNKDWAFGFGNASSIPI